MHSSRTTAPTLLSRSFLGLVAALVGAAALAPAAGSSADSAQRVPRLAFPLVAKTVLWDNYGDPRGNGRHAGIDMENPWRAPVVAVEPGKVGYSTSNLGGCMLYLYGRSGTMYMYIHLNNDVGPRNDNKGGCVEGTAYAVPDGASVLTGQQIGFNGDSGDADGNPHLHFEVHPNGGADVNPFRHLKRAAKLLFAGREGTPFSLGLRGRVLAVTDQDLRLSVTSVRSYPGGSWLDVDERPVDVAHTVDPLFRTAKPLASVKPASRVAVYTTKGNVTRKALLGAPGALTVSRVTPLAP